MVAGGSARRARGKGHGRVVGAAIGLVWGLSVWLVSADAAAITVSAEVDQKRIQQGDQIVLTVIVQGSFRTAPPVEMPRIDGVEFYSGGTSQSFNFSNGRTAATVSSMYYLRVSRATGFTIPALALEIDGKTFRTQPIKVEVSPAGGKQNRAAPPATTATGPAPTQSRQQDQAALAGKAGDEIFITTSVDKTEAYVGEQIVLSFRYYRRITPWDNPTYKPPRTEGFWREDLPPERNYRQRVKNMNYQVTEIRYALFPTRAGELLVEAAELSFPDDLFGRFFSTRRRRSTARQFRTEPVTITVRELPRPVPADFSGVVADDVKLTATVDRDTVPRGEPIGLAVTLRASGLLKTIDEIPVTAPEHVRLHDSTEQLDVDIASGRLRSVLKVEKVLVPTQEGSLELPPVELVYLHPGRGRYETARAHPGVVQVIPSDLPVAGEEASGFLRSEIARLSSDLAFVHPVTGSLDRRWRPWLESWQWWLLVLLPLASLACWRIYLGRRAAEARDPAGLRRRLALREAQRNLGKLSKEDDRLAALTDLSHTIASYVAARLDRPTASISSAVVSDYGEALERAEAGRRLAAIMELCDQERFGGGAGEVASTAELVTETRGLLAELDRVAGRAAARVAATGGPVVGLLWLGLLLTTASGTAGAVVAATPPSPGVDPTRLVAEGNRAYTDGDMDQALELYLEARRLGVNDPVVHFNLGNVHARRGELGYAIASYLRAQRLAPRDGDVTRNLNWVRSHIRDLALRDDQLPPVVAQAVGAVHFLTLDEWSFVLAFLLWCLTAFVAWGWYRGFGDGLRRLLLVLATALTVTVAVVAWRWYDERLRSLAVVVVEEVEVRSGPATTFPVAFKLHDGLTVDLRGEREGWTRLALGGDWVGWVPAGTVTAVRLAPQE